METGIRYLDGNRLSRATRAGAQWLIRQQNVLNDINVFPVPDGDTGTNMAFTMRSIFERMDGLRNRSVGEVCSHIADAALMGARGNSGAILAQFFQGLAEQLKHHRSISTETFAQAVQTATDWARAAVLEPREGTILTVMQDWATGVRECVTQKNCFAELLEATLAHARESLRRTPEKLAVLRESGVVDAGAQGFVYLLEGVLHFIRKGKLDDWAEDVTEQTHEAHISHHPEDIRYRYCTECLVEGEQLDLAAIRAALTPLGDSLIVAGSARKVRIHIHTDSPVLLFRTLDPMGVVSGHKADDMRVQHADASRAKQTDMTVVVDSACDLPQTMLDEWGIHVIPCRLNFGNQEYVDGVSMDSPMFYAKLAESPHHPKTSQPIPADFERMYAHVMSHYRHAFSIHIPEMYSGTFQSAQRAAAQYGNRVTVVDAGGVSIGSGLLALNVARRIREGWPQEAVTKALLKDVENLHLYVALPTMSFLVKGGRVSRTKGLVGQLLNVRPILQFAERGEIKPVAKAIGRQDVYEVMVQDIARMIGTRKGAQMAIGHGNVPEVAKRLSEQFQTLFSPSECITTELSAALSVHGGPGVIGVAFLLPPGK